MIIGVDLDGVCCDFYGEMRNLYSEWAEISLNKLPEANSFDLNCWGIFTRKDYEDFHRFAVTQRNLFKNIKMIKGARKYLKKLSDDGHRIRIVTHRLCIKYFHNIAIKQTVDWLDDNGIPFWDLCFLKQKEDIYADVFIEDTVDNIAKLRNNGIHTICFANKVNSNVTAPRVSSWKAVYNIISNMEK